MKSKHQNINNFQILDKSDKISTRALQYLSKSVQNHNPRHQFPSNQFPHQKTHHIPDIQSSGYD